MPFSPEWVYQHIELPFIKPLAQTILRGIQVDLPKLRALVDSLASSYRIAAEEWEELSGGINPNSSPQLSTFLPSVGVPLVKRTDSGKLFAVNKEVRADLEGDPYIDALQEIQDVKTLLGLGRNFLSLTNPLTGRLHPSYFQTGAATGRMSSADPNIQQVPKRGYWGFRFRECITASEGKVLLWADYSQMEVRLAYILSGDEAGLQVFREDRDPYLEIEELAFGTQGERRDDAKVVSLAIQYLEGSSKLARQIGVERGEAERIINRYYRKHAGLKRWQAEEIDKARLLGYNETYFGRRRYYPPIWGEGTHREVVNFPNQGTGADLLKIAGARLQEFPSVAYVHDEIVFEVEEERAEEVGREVKEVMESLVKFPIVLKAETHIGKHWGGKV